MNLLATRWAVGKAATLSISSLEMCLVNAAVPVSSDVVSTVTSSEPVLATLSSVTVPVVLLKRPRLVDVPKWGISHEANEWVGSSTYVADSAWAAAVKPRAAKTASRENLVMGKLQRIRMGEEKAFRR